MPRRHRRAGYADHLGDPGVAVVHELHDELRQRVVERVRGERQLLGDTDAHVCAWHAGATRVDELGRRVERGDVALPGAVGERPREGSGPAANVEHALPRADVGDLDQPGGELYAVAADVVVVRVGRAGEPLGVRRHDAISLPERAVPERGCWRLAWVACRTAPTALMPR